MLATILQVHRYGFFGVDGFFGIILGLVAFVIVVAILFKIFNLLMKAFEVPDPWASLAYWVVVLLMFLALLHFFGLY